MLKTKIALLLPPPGLVWLVCVFFHAAALGQSTPADYSSYPKDFFQVGTRLYFTADDGLHGRELWVYDEQKGGCRLAYDLIPGPSGADPVPWGQYGEECYFIALNADGGNDIWRWNDRERNMTQLNQSSPGEKNARPKGHANIALSGKLFCAMRDASMAWNLWSLLPGDTAFKRLTDFPPVNSTHADYRGWVMSDGTDVFLTREGLWRSDGTPRGTSKLVDIEITDFNGPAIVPLGQALVLSIRDPEHGVEPWITDGTPEGTRLLRDIRPGPDGAAGSQFGRMEDRVLFAADDGQCGLELWVTDGTSAGTVLLKDLCVGLAGSDPHDFVEAGGLLFFGADDGVHGVELWCSDGTTDGTRLVRDLNPSSASSSPYFKVSFGNEMCFCATTALHGDAIWITDGTEQGTRLLIDVISGPGPGGPNRLTPFQGQLFFTYDEPVHGEELWRWDPVSGQAQLVADINVPRFNPSTSPRSLTALGERVFFVAPDLEHGKELWASDGTEINTRCMSDAAPGVADSNPEDLTAGKHFLYFTAQNAQAGRELWRSDGTPEGTLQVADIRAGAQGAKPQHLLSLDETLYFTADDGSHGREVWSSDGSSTGTRLLAEFTPGINGTGLKRLVAFSGRLYAYVDGPQGDVSFFRIEAPGAPPTHILDLNGGLPALALEDLLTSGASPEMLVPWVHPCISDKDAQTLQVGDTTYFVAHTDRHGAELWSTDGSLAGTHLVCDTYPGKAGGSPRQLVYCDGRVYFIGDHPNYGQVLYGTDGTPLGSEMVRPFKTGTVLPPVPAVEIASLDRKLVLCAREPAMTSDLTRPVLLYRLDPSNGVMNLSALGPISVREGKSSLWQLTATSTRAFYTADDGVHGEELWSYDMNSRITLTKDILVPADLLPLRK